MELRDIISCYNKTANNYAEQYKDEIGKKHFDQILLRSFAAENINTHILDLGCGPGQTTKYLSDCGASNIIGTDIAPLMIEAAKGLYPSLTFETADMLALPYPDNSFGAALAFYSIVHFDETQLKKAFTEIRRILIRRSPFLFSFHIGDHILHLEDFLDHNVSVDFHFFHPTKIKDLVVEAGFSVTDFIVRDPYPEIEYPSKRAYIWVEVS